LASFWRIPSIAGKMPVPLLYKPYAFARSCT
jgi:hypothetical protein